MVWRLIASNHWNTNRPWRSQMTWIDMKSKRVTACTKHDGHHFLVFNKVYSYRIYSCIMNMIYNSTPDALQPSHRKHTVSVGLGWPEGESGHNSAKLIRDGTIQSESSGMARKQRTAMAIPGSLSRRRFIEVWWTTRRDGTWKNTWWRRIININSNPPPPPPYHHHHPTPLYHLHMSRSWSSHAAPLPAAIHAGPHCADSSLWGAKGPGKTFAPTVEEEEHDGKLKCLYSHSTDSLLKVGWPSPI